MARLWIFALVAAFATEAQAQSARNVAIDWAGVPDRVIAECGLDGLQSLIPQYVIERGHALVDRVGPEGVEVRLVALPARFSITAVLGETRAERRVPKPSPCESTIQLDLARAVLEAIDEVIARAPPPPAPPSLSTPVEPPAPLAAEPWFVDVAGVLAAPGAEAVLVGGAVALRAERGAYRFAAGLELTTTRPGGVRVLEPAALFAAHRAWALGELFEARVGLELAGLVHAFAASGQRDLHADGRLGLPLVLAAADLFWIAAVPYARAVPVEHREDGREIFSSPRWGIAARVGASVRLP